MTRLEFRATATRHLEGYAPPEVIAAVLDDADEYAARVAEEVSRPPLPWVLARKVKGGSDGKAAGI